MINIAFVGCGKITDHHLACLKKVKGIRPVAICDLNFQRSEQFGKRYNLKYYKNYNEMLSDNIKVDIVSIMTPPECILKMLKILF